MFYTHTLHSPIQTLDTSVLKAGVWTRRTQVVVGVLPSLGLGGPEPCSLAEESGCHSSECLAKQHGEDWVVQRILGLSLGGRSVGVPLSIWCLTPSIAGQAPTVLTPRAAPSYTP